MKKRTIIIIIAAFFIAGLGFAAGMLAKESQASKNSDIGIETAREIALASVGVSAEKATFTQEQLDADTYEIDFYTNSNEYDFEINSSTGAIINKEVTPRDLSLPESDAPQPEPSDFAATAPSIQTEESSGVISPGNNDNEVIGVAAAKEIALNHAGLSSASFIEAYLDYDDGIRVYDIEFVTDSLSYDYEINAYTGSVIEYDIEGLEYDD